MGRCRTTPAQPASRRPCANWWSFWKAPGPPPSWCPGGATRTPDHRASSQLVAAALAQLPRPPRRLEYVVWAWARAAPTDLPNAEDAVRGFRLDIAEVLPRKQRAIAAHRSQVAPGVFTDDPAGFLLSAEMLAHFAAPYEVYFEPLTNEPRTSLTPSRPITLSACMPPMPTRGTFKTSPYEQAKYADTLGARCPARTIRPPLRLAARWAYSRRGWPRAAATCWPWT